MDWFIASMDFVSTATFAAALLAVLLIPRRHMDSPSRVFLALSIMVYVFNGFSNVLQYGGITDRLDYYGDHAKILFVPFSLFFMYSFLSWQERNKSERAEKSLSEKELLIREIHHRVKNNLAVIQSLLRIQSRDIENAEAKERFRESRNRVRSMGIIHEMLQSSFDFKHLNFSDYTRRLVTQLFDNYRTDASRVKLVLDVSDVNIDVDTMIPCGLILNELVSNALKYAFPGGREGEISVSFRRGERDNYVLVVRDNGKGLPDGFDVAKTDSLGMQLVTSFIEQIEGVLEVRQDGGTEFRITLKENGYIPET